jgi:hypothetical protein
VTIVTAAAAMSAIGERLLGIATVGMVNLSRAIGVKAIGIGVQTGTRMIGMIAVACKLVQ